MDRRRRFGNYHGTISPHKTRYNKIGLNYIMKFYHSLAVYKAIGNLNGYNKGLEMRILLVFLYFFYFVFGFDAENTLDYKHREDNTYYSKRISCRIAAGHQVGLFWRRRHCRNSLLSSRKTWSIGHRSAHDSNKCRYVFDITEEINTKYYCNVEYYRKHGKHIKPYPTFLKRRKETRAYLKTDGKNEENQSEFPHKFQNGIVHHIAQMPHEDTHKKYKSNTQRHATYLKLADKYTRRYHKRI